MSQHPNSYIAIIATEYWRYLTSVDEASETIICDSDTPEEMKHLQNIHNIIKSVIALIWDTYILDDVGQVLYLYDVDQDHMICPRSPLIRSKLEESTSSVRSLLYNIQKSYLLQVIMSGYALDELKNSIDSFIQKLCSTLLHIEYLVPKLEEYMTWLEHGVGLVYSYTGGKIPKEDLYTDSKVKAYALLKYSDCNALKVAHNIDELVELLDCINDISTMVFKLYLNMTPKSFEHILHAITINKLAPPIKRNPEFQTIHSINSYIKNHIQESLDSPAGMLYNANMLLAITKELYIDKLANELTESVAFLHTESDQRLFIDKFEHGKLYIDRIDNIEENRSSFRCLWSPKDKSE